MSLPDLDELVAPLSQVEPCGPNLEYDPMFRELEEAAAGRPERQFGNFIEPARAPDLLRVQRLATLLFERTKDLRVAVAWTGALTATDGIAGAAAGLKLVARLLTMWPGELHPVVEPDEEHPTRRWNVLTELDAPFGFVAGLRDLRLNDSTRSVSAWLEMHQAVSTIREAMGYESYEDALSELQAFLDHAPKSDSVPGREAHGVEPDGTAQERWSQDRQELLDRLCRAIDRADFDPAAVCRRAHRISFEHFLDLASETAPARRQQVVAFLHLASEDPDRRPV
jgi:type VI secretion system ImpA family protein